MRVHIARQGRERIPTDDFTLIALGLGIVLALWLVFSLIRKVFGLALVIALALGGWYLWNNPEAFQSVSNTLSGFFSFR